MPCYIIERQYLLPVYQHLALESPDLESACRDALDDGEQDWEDAQEDYEGSRPTTIVSAIEIASEAEWATATKSQYERSGLMYDSRHEFIEIPRKFTERDRLGLDRKLSNRLLIELDMGLQPTFHTIYCGGDRYRTHSRAVFGGGALSR